MNSSRALPRPSASNVNKRGMQREQLKQKTWYWVRRDDGQIVPYVFHRTRWDTRTRRLVADFYVGSLLRSWPLGRVLGEAQMPEEA